MILGLAFWLSIVLAIAGCVGIYLAGKGRWQGWALGLAIQPVWILFGVLTHGYGLCLTSLLYSYVYWKSLRASRSA